MLLNSKALVAQASGILSGSTFSEEVYRGIIEDEAGFPEDVLEGDFGKEFVLCRQLHNELNFAYLPNICNVFGQNEGQDDARCSALIDSLRDLQRERKRLEENTALPESNQLLTEIQKINASFADERLQRCTSQGLFSAFLYFALQGGSQYKQFERWVLKNHQYELQKINASDIIRIFEKIAQSRKRQIFVSMQFSDNTKPNYEAIKAAVDDVNAEHRLDIQLREIRIDQFDTGYSYEINAEILRLIEESGLLIADLTAGNKNVYHEIGYLMGLNQGKGLPHENFILLHNGEIGNSKDDVGFNLHGIKQLRVKDTNAMREQVKQQIKVYYGL